MKRLAKLLVVVAACGGSNRAPPVPSIAMPAGSALKPFDSANAGFAHPSGLDGSSDKVYVALANTDATLTKPTGPGFLAAVIPSTAATTLVDLGGSAGNQCLNPGFVQVSGSSVYVLCTGDYRSGSGGALVEVDPSGNGSVRRTLAIAGNPSGLAVSGTRAWYGDSLSDRISAVDLGSFTVTGPAVALACPKSNGSSAYQYVPALTFVNGDLYALCASDIGGTVSRRDGTSGIVKSHADTGPLPTALTGTGDGRIAVLNAGDNSVMLVSPTNNALTAQTGLILSSAAALQDIRSHGQFLFTVSSGTNAVQKIDLNAAGGPKVVAEAAVGEKANPWNVVPLDDDSVMVSNLLVNTLVSVTSECAAGESVLESAVIPFALALLVAAGPRLHLGPPPPPQPRRVVTLAPALSEIVLALGARDRLVGVTRFDDDPRTAGLPRIGGYNDPQPEAVLALTPDLALAEPAPQNHGPVQTLAGLGVPVEAFPLSNIADIEQAIEGIAALLGLPERGRDLVAQLERARRTARERAGRSGPRTLLVFGLQPLVVAGPRSFAGELLADAGGRNAAGDSDKPFFRLSAEAAVHAAPDVVVLCGVDAQPGRAPIPGLEKTRVAMLRSTALLHPGARLPQALDDSVAALHP